MAKKNNDSTGIIKYNLKFTEDIYVDVKDKDGKISSVLSHKKGSPVSCGPESYEVYKSVTEVVSTKTK